MWVKFEIDKDDLIYIKIDKVKKFFIYLFLKVFGLEYDEIFVNIENLCYFSKISRGDEVLIFENCLLELYNNLKLEELVIVKGC